MALGEELGKGGSQWSVASRQWLDPLTAAMCTPGQIKAMTMEMFAAEEAFLPEYR